MMVRYIWYVFSCCHVLHAFPPSLYSASDRVAMSTAHNDCSKPLGHVDHICSTSGSTSELNLATNEAFADAALIPTLTSSTHVNQLAHDQDARPDARMASGCQQSPRSRSKVPLRAASRDLHSRRTRTSMYVQRSAQTLPTLRFGVATPRRQV